ncbi:MAG: DUF4398 domain-containing protein [Gammaproteobacteria bacterium]|nr:DUF4398 domain-containing protein [Gammaproteobacteria bacterium]
MGESGYFHRRAGRWASAAGLMLCVMACVTTPPYQEMSDARQAIAVAEEVGAAQKSPALLAQARQYLANAKEKMEKRSFSIARSPALLAREKAIEAARHAKQRNLP